MPFCIVLYFIVDNGCCEDPFGAFGVSLRNTLCFLNPALSCQFTLGLGQLKDKPPLP